MFTVQEQGTAVQSVSQFLWQSMLQFDLVRARGLFVLRCVLMAS